MKKADISPVKMLRKLFICYDYSILCIISLRNRVSRQKSIKAHLQSLGRYNLFARPYKKLRIFRNFFTFKLFLLKEPIICRLIFSPYDIFFISSSSKAGKRSIRMEDRSTPNSPFDSPSPKISLVAAFWSLIEAANGPRT